MTILACAANGNLTAAATWGVVDNGATTGASYLNSESANTALTTSPVAGSSFQWSTGAPTVDGIAFKLASRAATPSGTITIELYDVTGTASVDSVQLNVSDLPLATTTDLEGGWIFVKFGSSHALSNSNDYAIRLSTSASAQVNAFRDATANNWSHFLRTTTTQAPVAGDDMIVCGEKTAAATETARSVTMNETATTDYGSAATSTVTPAISICDGGTMIFAITAATAFLLKVSGNIVVYAGGTLSVGTSGSEMPRDSSGTIQFDCASNGDFGLLIRNLGAYNSYGLSRTAAKLYDRCLLASDVVATGTSLTLDTSTGWLSGDELAIASTTRTAGDCELVTASGNESASTIAVSALASAHSGTGIIAAEVILLTRNVRVLGTSASVCANFEAKASAVCNISWTEFKYIGASAGTAGSSTAISQQGLETACDTGASGAFNISYSSIHQNKSQALKLASGHVGIAVDHLVVWDCGQSLNTSYSVLDIEYNISDTTTVIDYLLIMKINATTYGWFARGHAYHDMTHFTVIGANYICVNYSITYGVIGGTFSNWTFHSCGNNAFLCGSAGAYGLTGVIDTITIWRMNATGFQCNYSPELTVKNLTIWGCLNYNINCSTIRFENLVSDSDVSFATTSAFAAPTNGGVSAEVVNGSFSQGTSPKAAHTNDINIGYNGNFKLRKCLFGATNHILISYPMRDIPYVISENHQQVANDHRVYYRGNGTLAQTIVQTDTATYRTASPSMRITPCIAGMKVETALPGHGVKVPVASAASVTVSVYVRLSATAGGDSNDYVGAAPRLILRRNDVMGITADTVLDTHTGTLNTWELLSGTTATAPQDGVYEFIVDCSITSSANPHDSEGHINVDDWATA